MPRDNFWPRNLPVQFSAISLSNLSKYISSDLDRAWIRVALRYSLLGGALLAAAWVIYFALVTISIPYPIEYREGATQVMTQYLLEGKNPYALENQPLAMNNNGIVYNLFVLPLAMLFGNTLLVHRVVTFVFILLCGALAFRASFASNKDVGLATVCGELVVMAVGAMGGLGVFPSSMGAFFFLLAIIVPFRRSFDYRGLIFSAFLSLLAFYTKPYFVLSFAIVLSYVFIFHSKKKAVIFGLLFALISLISFVLVRAIFPFYFIYIILSNVSNATRDMSYAFDQMKELVVEFYPSIILASVLVAAAVTAILLGRSMRDGLFLRSNILALDRPLFSRRLNYSAYVFCCSTLAFVSILGPHRGAVMTYSYQLMLPPFFIWLCGKLRSQSRLALLSIPLLLFNMFTFAEARFDPSFLEQKNSKQWARLYEYVPGSTHILNSPIIVPEMIRVGIPPIDSGKNEYFWNIHPYPPVELIGPDYSVILGLRERYDESIDYAVAIREYDKVISVPGSDFFIRNRHLRQHYVLVDHFRVTMPQTDQIWNVEIWEPSAESVE
jgi:hypothetical protein